MVAPVIVVREVVNRFGAQVVHDGVSFEVRPGEIFGIVGGSGSGKSVLLKTLLGLRRPDWAFAEVILLWLSILATILVFLVAGGVLLMRVAEPQRP